MTVRVAAGVENLRVNLVDHPWVPVTTTEGTMETWTLRDVFAHADRATFLAPHLAPVETEAMLRFLESVAAIILREGGPVTNPGALEAVFKQWAERFNLLDPDMPFMQEWHVPTGAVRPGAYRLPMQQLFPHVPGKSSKQWCLRIETGEITASTLPILLIVKWFHGKNSNAASPAIYPGKQIAGAPSGGMYDTAFHLLGPTLAETLPMNVPESWLDTTDLPAWLDQDATHEPAVLTSGGAPLWRATWTPNRPLVLHNGGVPAGWVIGQTARPIPNMGSTAGTKDARDKENAKLVTATNYTHALVPDPKTGAEKPVVAPVNLHSTEGYLHWYERGFGDALSRFGADRVEPNRNERVAFHNDRCDSQGNRKVSEWLVIASSMVRLPGSRARDVILGHAKECADALRNPLKVATEGHPGRRDAPLAGDTRRNAMAAYDEHVLPALAALARGEEPDLITVMTAITHATERVFTAATESVLTPATTGQVMRARAELARRVNAALSRRRRDLEPMTEKGNA